MSINVLFQPSYSARDEYMELHKFYSQWAGGCWVQLCIQGFILASWSLKLGIQLTLGSKTDSLEQIVNTNPPWARAKEMGEERRCVCRCNLKWDYSCEWKRQHTGRQSVLGVLGKKKKKLPGAQESGGLSDKASCNATCSCLCRFLPDWRGAACHLSLHISAGCFSRGYRWVNMRVMAVLWPSLKSICATATGIVD